MRDKVNRTLTTTLTAVLVVLFGLAGTAHAVAPAGSKIVGTAAVTGTGSTAEGVSTGEATTSVDPTAAVTVELTPSAPHVSGQATSYGVENGDFGVSYSIASTANGEDTYDLSLVTPVDSDFVGSADVSAGTTLGATFHQTSEAGEDVSITQVTLGATAASDASSGSTVTTPSDGTAGDDSINGIVADDNVVIGGVVYSVVSASDDGTTGTITLDASVDVTTGTLISEVQYFWAEIGDLGANTGDSAGTVTVTVTAAVEGDPAMRADGAATTVTVYNEEAAATKTFVRIDGDTRDAATLAVDYPGSAIYLASDGATLYVDAADPSMVADAGTTMEYIIVSAAGTEGSLTAVTFAATIPAFTSYVPNSTSLNGVLLDGDDGGVSALEAGMAACDPITTLAIGCDDGLIVMASTAEATFQVTIDDATDAFSAPGPIIMEAWEGTGAACYDETGIQWAAGPCLWSEVEALGGQDYCNARADYTEYSHGSESDVTTALLSCL